MKSEEDYKWYDERNQEGRRPSINHRGLMPKCFNCNGTYQSGKSDREGQVLVTHPRNSCPFKKSIYGKDELECIAQIRESNEAMLKKRTT